MGARYFEEGRWNTETSCKAGVCSSAPWDWELAKKPGKCETVGGFCSRQCKVCDSYSDNKEFCIAQTINTQEGCTAASLVWNEDRGVCYGTARHADCFARSDAKTMSCRDMGDKGCTAPGWKTDPFYNGDFYSEQTMNPVSMYVNVLYLYR